MAWHGVRWGGVRSVPRTAVSSQGGRELKRFQSSYRLFIFSYLVLYYLRYFFGGGGLLFNCISLTALRQSLAL